MNRFEKTGPRRFPFGRVLPAAFFLAVLALFLLGLNSLSGVTARQEAEGLKSSILQSAVHCYALEGFYPDSLDYLQDHYGLSYDRDKYVVSYEAIGSNLMPDVSVIPLQGGATHG